MSVKRSTRTKIRQRRTVKASDSLKELKNNKDILKDELEVIKKDFNKFYKSLSTSAVKIKSWAMEKASEKGDYFKSRIYSR